MEKAAMQQKLSKCILHIGTPKTGSTAIQQFLKANYDALSERDILAHAKLANELAKALIPWHVRTRHLKKLGVQNPQKHARLKKKVNRALHKLASSEQNAQKVVILSSERFYSPLNQIDLNHLKEILDYYFESVDLVCFFRDPLDFVASGYNESIKAAYSGSLKAYIKHYINSSVWRYFSNFKLWSSVFGADRCFFVAFNPDQQTNYDVVKHFCAILNLDLAGLNFSQGERFNPQMSAKLAVVYRLINICVPLWKRGKDQRDVLNPANSMLKRFFKELGFLRHGRKLRLTEDQRQMVQSATDTEYRRMLDYYNTGRKALSGSISAPE